MPWARASALDRHIKCAAAAWLPRWDRATWMPPYLGLLPLPTTDGPAKDSFAADWGTELHAAKAGQGIDPWAEAVEPVREIWWPSKLGVHEQAYAYNCKTGLVEKGPTNLPTPEMDAWKNSRAVECVTGTADWDATLPSCEPWIDDLKSGWQKPPVRTYAMLFYSLCRNTIDKYDTCRLSITHAARAKVIDPDKWVRYWLQVSNTSLILFQDELERAWRKARPRTLIVVPEPVAGEHCKWCPSASICPTNAPPKDSNEDQAPDLPSVEELGE